VHPIARVLIWLAGTAAAAFTIFVLWFFVIPYWRAPDSLDRAEARTILSSELQHYRQKPYSELTRLVGNSERRETTGKSGARYQLVVFGHWDSRPNADVRIIASVDDGGRSAWRPMTDSFILDPSGKFVGE
jgi:hypothetical protein